MKQRTPLDNILLIVVTVLLLWFGIKWASSAKKGKKLLGYLMLVIMSVNILNASGTIESLMTKAEGYTSTQYKKAFQR